MNNQIIENISCKKCGLIGDFDIREKGQHKMAYCNGCGAFIKNIAYTTPRFFFGKYKGQEISKVDDLQYLHWVVKSGPRLSPHIKQAIDNQIAALKVTLK